MKRFRSFFAESAAELKNIRSLAFAAVLTAMYAVTYSPFAGNVIIVPGLIEIRFGFLVIAVAAMLFGPFTGMLVAVLGDLIGTLLFYGGSFFFGYPLNWAIMGFIFGCFLYKEKVTIPRIALSMVINTVVVNQFLTTAWQAFLGFGPYKALFISRIPKNLILLPINIILLVFVLRSVVAIYRRVRRTTA